MTNLLLMVMLVCVPFLSGLTCQLLLQTRHWSTVSRPLTQATLLFCLGASWMYLEQISSDRVSTFRVNLLPPLLMIHFVLALVSVKRDEGNYSVHHGALLFSAACLAGMCLTNHLELLFLFGELWAVSTWLLIPSGERRTHIRRWLVTSALIGVGILFVMSELGTGELSSLMSESHSQMSGKESLLNLSEKDSGFRLRAGILCLVFGVAWRLRFFPFSVSSMFSRGKEWLGWVQQQVALVTAGLLSLAIILPLLPDQTHLGQMMLAALAVPTLIRETFRSCRLDSLNEKVCCCFQASVAFMWLALGQELFAITHLSPTESFFAVGLDLLSIELCSSLISLIVVSCICQELTDASHSVSRHQDLLGLFWTNRLLAIVLLVAVLSGAGFPGLLGFPARIGLMAGAFNIAGAEDVSALGYSCFGLVIVVCEMIQMFLALWLLQTLCDASSWKRTCDPSSSWRTWAMAVALILLSLRTWV